MGTAIRFESRDAVDVDVIDGAFDWLRWVDRTFSTYRADSEISLIGSGRLAVERAHPWVQTVLDRCANLTSRTRGWFDIRPSDFGLPALDPSGFVKGWSIDEAARRLRHTGASDFCLNAGGDVLCVGRPRTHGSWRIGIRHPRHARLVACVLEIEDLAVATSGAYERGDHVWIPNGGLASELESATVVGPELGVADALATALYASSGDVSFLSAFRGYEAVLITRDRRLRWTPGLDRYLAEPEKF